MSDPRIQSQTAGDGYVWKYRRYEPAAPARGEIVALHGIQSHGGWYDASSRWLARHGWGVSFLDRRGSGLNDHDRGDCPSFRRLLDDVDEYVRTLAGKTVVLLGVSWGGKLAAAYPKRHPGRIAGLVLVAPGIRPRVRPGVLTRLSVLFRRLFQPRRQLPIPLNDPDLFTANAERREFIRNDPSALHTASLRFLFESRRLDVYLRFAAKRVRVPTFVALAGQDRIIDNARTRKFVRRFRGPAEVREYPGAHHTLEFEQGGPPFLDDLLRWLDRLPS